MQADINNAKSKGYNCLLRYFQYSILLFCVNRILHTTQPACSEAGRNYNSIIGLLSLILIGLNLLALCYVHFRARFARTEFFIALSINMVFTLVIIGLSLMTILKAPSECMQVILLQKWSIFTSVLMMLMALSILVCSLYWVQRYTNTPGNIAWAYMFLTISWSTLPSLRNFMLGIGFAYLVISIITFLVNINSLCGGTTTTSKKCLKCWWIFVIILMVAFEIIALVGYLAGTSSGQFYDVGANRLLQMFLVGNFIDLLFWLWGLLALQYENGDLIRDQLIDRDQFVDPDTYTSPPNPYIHGIPFYEDQRPKPNATRMGTILH